jgi:hypothetical protein
LCAAAKFETVVDGSSLSECMDDWSRKKELSKKLPLLICWNVWLERNRLIFEGKTPSSRAAVHRAIGAFRNKSIVTNQQILRVNTINRIVGFAVAFFDGASVAGGSSCGAGGVVKTRDASEFRWYFNGGEGTNTKAELLGTWASLFIAKHLDIQDIQLLGDSKAIIDWLKKKEIFGQ